MYIKLLKTWLLVFASVILSCNVFARDLAQFDAVAIRSLPLEAQQTLVLIKANGPFPYHKDGAIFGNYEGILPKQKRGYYREYTVKTPHARNRGARRIISGGAPPAPQEFFYTADHYQTFQRIKDQ